MGGGLMVGVSLSMPHQLEREPNTDPQKGANKGNGDMMDDQTVHGSRAIFWRRLVLAAKGERFR